MTVLNVDKTGGIMGQNVSQKLIESHLIEGVMEPGREIGIKIDQTLTQDATGTVVMLEFEAMGIPRIKTETSVQYVDHNLLQIDFKNADDHIFLRDACKKFGLWYSRPGNGVSHPVHMENFGCPGKTLLGSDSHTPSAGSMGMLAIGAGGLDVATAMAGEPFYLKMPLVMGVKLTGQLPDWTSAKDIILEMLRRHGVAGGVGKVLEYYGPGLQSLSTMDRHVIANMGAELGATSTVFPSDANVKVFLEAQQRADAWIELTADENASYDLHDEIDLSQIEPLIACPSSPGNVVPVRDVAGKEINQSYIGSSANPGLRDFAITAMIVDGKIIHEKVSLDINPASRQTIENLSAMGLLEKLIHAGARMHQAGCNGCIGMGQAPATGKISLRTVPRNFPGRSGTIGDQVYLCSPETAAASAIKGVITDPRTLDFPYPEYKDPDELKINRGLLLAPDPNGAGIIIEKGPNIKGLPPFTALPENLRGTLLLKMDDNISTDDIMPAGAQILPFRSNIPEISKFSFSRIDETFYDRALAHKETDSIVIGGSNYGQGSSREHAALGPRYLGIRLVIVKSFARIHWQNLVNFGLLPLTFINEEDYDLINQGDALEVENVISQIQSGKTITVKNLTQNSDFLTEHTMTQRDIDMVIEGGKINLIKKKQRG